MKDIDLDLQRQQRIGMPEIIYGQHKSPQQLLSIADTLKDAGKNMLITRCSSEQVVDIEGEYDPVARTFTALREHITPINGQVAVIAAGSSDAPVAKEALNTLNILGCQSQSFIDCGVAGVHRLLKHSEAIQRCQVIICCAGFEGALPSVVAGLFPQAVIAVPTSVGYGVAEGGHAALNAMLASCAGGVTVMNIDNGCGAAMAARRILQSFSACAGVDIQMETDND